MKKELLFTYEWDFNKALHVAWHKKMWLWLAENPDKEKFSFLRGHIESEDFLYELKCIYNDCFMCRISELSVYNINFFDCKKDCILNWPGNNCCEINCVDDDLGLFSRWEYNIEQKNYKKSSQLAIAIANLPVR